MSIPTPPAPPMTPKVRAFLYGALGWLGVAAFLAFVAVAAIPNADVPVWLNVANAIINGANVVFFVAKDNTPGQNR